MGKQVRTEQLPANLQDHAAARACRQLWPECSPVGDIEILQLQQKSAVYRLVRASVDHPTIIAKRCCAATAAVERIVYDALGDLIPPPAFLCLGSVSDGEDCWLFFADAGPGAYSPACPAHRVLAGRWLATIHGIGLQSGLASRLPRRDPDYYLAELQPARATLRENFSNPFLPADDVANLRALVTDCDQLENQWREVEKICAPAPRTVVHGDFVLKNMRIRETPAGPAFWAFDWEHAGWGVPAVDLAQFTGHSASPDLKSYGQVLRAFVPGLDDTHLRQLAACGTLFRVLDAIAWESPSLSFRPYRYLSRTMAILGSYRARLHDALQAAGWARN